jgi:thiol:disulfide interchange protein DsbD
MLPVTRALPGLVVAAAIAVPSGTRFAHAKVELVPESVKVAAGDTVTLGLRFTIDPDWHIYWRNPGESGGPPSVKWDAPPELTLDPIQWPVPERVVVPGDTSYGYRGGVMLLVPARVALTASAGTKLTLKGAVDYQICKDICIRETAPVAVTIEVGASTEARDMPDFTQARASLPRPMPDGWHASANVQANELVISIDTGQVEPSASFLPYQSGLIDDGARQKVDTAQSGVTIHLPKSLFFAKQPASLDGVVLLAGGAFEIRAPIQN